MCFDHIHLTIPLPISTQIHLKLPKQLQMYVLEKKNFKL